jgi:hypothetical protein
MRGYGSRQRKKRYAKIRMIQPFALNQTETNAAEAGPEPLFPTQSYL